MNIEQIREFAGLQSKPVRNEVQAEAIRKFAQALGDTSHQSTAPPTFCCTFDFGVIEGLPFASEGLMQGEQYYEYYRPIVAGDVLFCSAKFADAYEKRGTLGNMFFLVYEQQGVTEAGEPVFFARSNLIYRG